MNHKVYHYQGFTPIDIQLDTSFKNKGDIEQQTKKSSNQKKRNTLTPQIIIENKVFTNKKHISYNLYVITNTQPVDEAKQVALRLLPYSITISFVISFIAAYIYSKIITKPIKNILRVTKEMEKLKKNSYCIVESKDEIGMIAENINELYDTLWNTIDSLEQKVEDISKVEKEKVEFLRDASHELKTPLTS